MMSVSQVPSFFVNPRCILMNMGDIQVCNACNDNTDKDAYDIILDVIHNSKELNTRFQRFARVHGLLSGSGDTVENLRIDKCLAIILVQYYFGSHQACDWQVEPEKISQDDK